MKLYERFYKESGRERPHNKGGEVVPQRLIVGDADHCVDELTNFIREFGVTDIVTMAVPPGLRPDDMASSLEALFKEVVPRVHTVLR